MIHLLGALSPPRDLLHEGEYMAVVTLPVLPSSAFLLFKTMPVKELPSILKRIECRYC
jgi:hypothetical protein